MVRKGSSVRVRFRALSRLASATLWLLSRWRSCPRQTPDVDEDRDFERPEDLGRPVEHLSYLLDTNVVSELRKGERASSNVTAWFAGVAEEGINGPARHPFSCPKAAFFTGGCAL